MDAIVVSIAEAAKILSLQAATVQRLVENGEIPAFREGRNWKIPVALLKEYVETRALKEAEQRRKNHAQ